MSERDLARLPTDHVPGRCEDRVPEQEECDPLQVERSLVDDRDERDGARDREDDRDLADDERALRAEVVHASRRRRISAARPPGMTTSTTTSRMKDTRVSSCGLEIGTFRVSAAASRDHA